MRLVIAEPTSVLADHADIVSVRAEDDSGSFGILPGHTDLLTALVPSILAWRHADGRRGFCAVRRGVLSVRDGRLVAVATRQGQIGDDPDRLEQIVLERLRTEDDAERVARIAATRLHMKAVRQIVHALRPGRTTPAEPRP